MLLRGRRWLSTVGAHPAPQLVGQRLDILNQVLLIGCPDLCGTVWSGLLLGAFMGFLLVHNLPDRTGFGSIALELHLTT